MGITNIPNGPESKKIRYDYEKQRPSRLQLGLLLAGLAIGSAYSLSRNAMQTLDEATRTFANKLNEHEYGDSDNT